VIFSYTVTGFITDAFSIKLIDCIVMKFRDYMCHPGMLQKMLLYFIIHSKLPNLHVFLSVNAFIKCGYFSELK